MHDRKGKFDFNSIRNRILKDKMLTSEISKLNVTSNDVETYLSYYIYKFTDIINNNSESILKSENKEEILSLSKQNLSIIGNEIYKRTTYLDTFIEENIKEFSNCKIKELDYINPWLIKKEQLLDEFNCDKKDTMPIEIYAKNMLWSNRAAKSIFDVQNAIVEKVSKKNRFDSDTIKKIFNNIKINILKNTEEFDKNGLINDFLIKYSKYIGKNISLKELENEPSFKAVNQLLDKVKKGKNSINISMKELYGYISCDISKARLYTSKGIYQDKIVGEYSKLCSEKKLNGITLSKFSDENSMENKTIFNNIIRLKIPGYSDTFSSHMTSRHISDLEKKYNLNIPDVINLRENTTYAQYKYNDKQKRYFEMLSNRTLFSSDKVERKLNFTNYMIYDYNSEYYIRKNNNESRDVSDAR